MQKYLTRRGVVAKRIAYTTMKTRVLLVEDELPVRVFMDEALHFFGYDVTVADGAQTALARLGSASFDVIITDHRMPGMEGLELV